MPGFEGLLLVGLLTTRGHAQFYAPDTEYHDPVQRVFVVEAARVLAWRENLSRNLIREISYQLRTEPDGRASWEIGWLDAKGKPLQTVKVSYPRSALQEGAAFYREVFRQLCSAHWKSPARMEVDEAWQLYWYGAERAAVSREESLAMALAVADVPSPEHEVPAPKLAGMLVHGALPGVAGHLSLDSILTARSAAWLALSERACSNSSPRLWAPILFLAGREGNAREFWRQPQAGPLPTNAWTAAWDLWLRQPTSRDVFLFAAETKNWPAAMAMLAYDVNVNDSGELLAEVLEPLAGSSQTLARTHNYAPLMACQTGIAGGHIMNGVWPVLQRRSWLDLLHRYRTTKDGKADLDLGPELLALSNALPKAKPTKSELDPCLAELAAFSKLLKRAHDDGTGPLAPAAVVTARDLLNYGWEAAAVQLAYRYAFVAYHWGVPDQGQSIEVHATHRVPGVLPLFRRMVQSAAVYPDPAYHDQQVRLQNVDGIFALVGWSPNPFDNGADSNRMARVFAQRCWLRPSEFEWQARSLWDGGQFNQITNLIEGFREAGGSLAAANVLRYLTSIGTDYRPSLPGVDQTMVQLAQRLPQPSELYVDSIWSKEFEKKSDLETAQSLEKLYWRNPGSSLDRLVFWYYVSAGAYDAARRFYRQARDHFFDRVRVAGSIGLDAYVLGYCVNDEPLRTMALQDSACASFNDMKMHIWEAALHEDPPALRKQVDEVIERYDSPAETQSRGRRLREFLKLLPALADPASPDRTKAIQFFTADKNWVALRWIWAEKYHLSREEASIFLGAGSSNRLQQFLVACVEQDTGKVEHAHGQLEETDSPSEGERVLALVLFNRIKKLPPVPDQPDLRPADVNSTRTDVLARLKTKSRGNAFGR